MVNYFSVDLTHCKYFVLKMAFSCNGGIIIHNHSYVFIVIFSCQNISFLYILYTSTSQVK